MARAASAWASVGASAGKVRRGGKAQCDPPGDRLRLDRPVEVHQAVGQRRRELPPVGRLFGRIGRGHDPDRLGERKIPHHAFEHHPQHRRLHGRWCRGQLVEKQEAVTGRSQAPGPQWRCHLHGPVDDDGETGEVGRLPDRSDDHLGRPAETLPEGAHDRRLAGPGAPPQQNGDARLDRDRQRLTYRFTSMALTSRPIVPEPDRLSVGRWGASSRQAPDDRPARRRAHAHAGPGRPVAS